MVFLLGDQRCYPQLLASHMIQTLVVVMSVTDFQGQDIFAYIHQVLISSYVEDQVFAHAAQFAVLYKCIFSCCCDTLNMMAAQLVSQCIFLSWLTLVTGQKQAGSYTQRIQ